MKDNLGNILIEEMVRSKAVFDSTKTYRYSLVKEWDSNKKHAIAVLYNPGKEYVKENGHTINNILLTLMENGNFGSLEVVNLYALIGMQRGALSDSEKSRGKDNFFYIEKAITNPKADMIIAGWGSYSRPSRKYEQTVFELISRFDGPIMCFGTLKGNKPAHPSRAVLTLTPFDLRC